MSAAKTPFRCAKHSFISTFPPDCFDSLLRQRNENIMYSISWKNERRTSDHEYNKMTNKSLEKEEISSKRLYGYLRGSESNTNKDEICNLVLIHDSYVSS